MIPHPPYQCKTAPSGTFSQEELATDTAANMAYVSRVPKNTFPFPFSCIFPELVFG
jgi:hypothetical protein